MIWELTKWLFIHSFRIETEVLFPPFFNKVSVQKGLKPELVSEVIKSASSPGDFGKLRGFGI